MIYTIQNTSFSEIRTIILLKSSEYGNLFNGGTNNYRILLRASRNSLLGVSDFGEYSFEHIPSKNRFNDTGLLDYLDQSEINNIIHDSLDPDNIQRYVSSIIPTESDDTSVSDTFGFFGTIEEGNQTLYAVEIPEKYDMALFSGNSEYSILKYSESSIKFAARFGVGSGDTSSVYSISSIASDSNYSYETGGNKILWFLVSSDGEVSGFNISYSSWKNSINPFRNMNQYLLRKDEMYNAQVGLENIGGTGDYWFDESSGTYLGKKSDTSTPILTRMLKNSSLYSRDTIYMENNEVNFNGYIWKSVCDYNVGNNPYLSSKWVCTGKIPTGTKPRVEDDSDIVTPGGSAAKPRGGDTSTSTKKEQIEYSFYYNDKQDNTIGEFYNLGYNWATGEIKFEIKSSEYKILGIISEYDGYKRQNFTPSVEYINSSDMIITDNIDLSDNDTVNYKITLDKI